MRCNYKLAGVLKMNVKQIIGIVLIVLGVISVLIGGVNLNDILETEKAMGDFLTAFGAGSEITDAKNECYIYIAAGVAMIFSGAFMARKNTATELAEA